LDPSGSFTVRVEGADVTIPYRIYNEEPPSKAVQGLDEIQRDVLACLYTRHHNGHVRQANLRRIIQLTRPWVPPFVVQLIGEYVVEILLDIQEGLKDLDLRDSPQHREYGAFVANNPAFLDLTSQRVASYWACYHGSTYPDRQDYPGSRLLLR
jgi:hypothetical protein